MKQTSHFLVIIAVHTGNTLPLFYIKSSSHFVLQFACPKQENAETGTKNGTRRLTYLNTPAGTPHSMVNNKNLSEGERKGDGDIQQSSWYAWSGVVPKTG